MHSKTIIFCQAPADVPFVLAIYEEVVSRSAVSIFVINVNGLFTFLSSLNLQLEKLVYIPYKLNNIKSIPHLLEEKRRINQLWEEHFEILDIAEVYFFSRFEDWLTAGFIHRFSKKMETKIWYADHYDEASLLYKRRHKFNFRKFIYKKILKYLTGVNFSTQIIEKLPEFPVSKYKIKKIRIELIPEVFNKYAYVIDDFDLKIPGILFFDSPIEKTVFNSLCYDKSLVEIIQLLKDFGFRIIVKGHPRIGTSNAIKNLVDREIPSYVPGEFIDPDQFELCLGLYTTAICHFANNTNLPTFSLMKLFEASNPETYKIGINYLIQQTDGKIHFCESLKDLETIAKAIRKKFDERH